MIKSNSILEDIAYNKKLNLDRSLIADDQHFFDECQDI